MGFERTDGSEFSIPVSDTQAYRQFGNAVVVPAVKAVAQLMKPHILDAIKTRPTRARAVQPTLPFVESELMPADG